MSEERTLKSYEVTDTFGTIHTVKAEYHFNNAGELVFRCGEKGASEVMAMFAPGRWSSFVKLTPETTETVG